MPLLPRRWIGTGLLFALSTGLGAIVVGYPFLTSHTFHLSLPLLGDIHVASAMFFDIGVFTLVVGSTLLILTAIVIGFAMTALFLVVLLASRGMSGTDHVDGHSARDVQEMP